jgi:hypothetical protein
MRAIVPHGFLVAVAAAVAIAFPATACASSSFVTDDYPASVNGSGEGHTLAMEGGFNVKCASVSYSGGELAEPSEQLTLTPTFSSCTAAGTAATVSPEGCTLRFHAGAKTGETTYAGTTDVVCPAGKAIVVTALAGNCVAQVGAQNSLSADTYTDSPEAKPPTATAKIALTGVKYTVTKDGFLCPFAGVGEKTGGSYSGQELLKASRGAEAVGFQVAEDTESMLCEEKPMLACENVFPASTLIETSLIPPLLHFQFVIGPREINCTKSTFAALTNEEKGNPLQLKNPVLLTESCKTSGLKKCEVAETANKLTANLESQVGGMFGYFFMPITFLFKCEKEIVCKYTSPGVAMRMTGGLFATIAINNQPFTKVGIGAEEVNCAANAIWDTDYDINAPAGVWPYRG